MDRPRRSGSGRPGGPARTGPGSGRTSRPAPAGRSGPSRPAGRRPAAAAPEPTTPAGRTTDARTQARRAPGGLTGRAAVLGLVVCALVLSLAYPTKEFLAQRGEISRLQQEQRDVAARVALLEERRRQLRDKIYIQGQARQRLQYVLPGETAYVVVAPSAPASRPDGTRDVPQVSKDGSWYDRLWGTVRAADGARTP